MLICVNKMIFSGGDEIPFSENSPVFAIGVTNQFTGPFH